jgi:hypothetical protein
MGGTTVEVHYPMFWLQILVPWALVLLGLVAAAVIGYRDRASPTPFRSPRQILGRVLAVASAAAVIALVIVHVAFNPYSSASPSPATLDGFAPMLVSATLAAAGGLLGKRSLLIAGFAIGFFPGWVGPYLLGTPGIFKWIPVAQFCYLVAAWCIGGATPATEADVSLPRRVV